MTIPVKYQKPLIIAAIAVVILFVAYKFGYLTFTGKKYEEDENKDLGEHFDAENIARDVYTGLDGGTEYDEVMNILNLLNGLNDDSLIEVSNAYTALFGKTDYPTLSQNLTGEDFNNWWWEFPLSAAWKVNEANNLRDDILSRMAALNIV